MSVVFAFLKASALTLVEYRFNFFSTIAANVIRKLAEYFAIWILMEKFKLIDGWNYFDLLLLFNINQMAVSISGLFFWSPMMEMENLVRNGSLDSLLIRPINLFMHLLIRKFEFSFLGNIGLSFVFFLIYFIYTDTSWNLILTLQLIVVLMGAILIYSAIHIFIGTLSFWTTQISMILNTVLDFRRFVNFPISVYDTPIQIFLTYVIPLALVNYYPLIDMFDKGSGHDGAVFLTMLFGVLLFAGSYMFFVFGSKHYQSTGS